MGNEKQYTRINLFGINKSRGTFDDFYNTDRYSSIEDAWKANDYVECDFVKDQDGIIYIEARHVKTPETKEYHRLNYQRCPAGLDVSDDEAGCRIANKLNH